MISFFRINDPVRLFAVLLLLALLRLPIFISGFDLLNSEFSWMIIGEKLNHGFVMYKDIQSNLGYLSALAYKFMDSLFGRSQLAYQILAAVLIGIQALTLNAYLSTNDVIREKGCVPAVFYVLLSFAFVDFYTLSPVLMSLTFLIPALGQLINAMKNVADNTVVLKVGMYTGLASLFYLPSITLLFIFFIVFLLFTKSNFKNYILLFVAYLFPVILFGLYFYWIGYFDKYFYDIFYHSIGLSKVKFMTLLEVIIVLFPLIVLTGLAILKVLTSSGFVNFQQRCHALMSLWLIAVGISLLLSSHFSAYSILLVLPACVYFISNFYFLTKRTFFKVLYFNVIILFSLIFSYMEVFYDKPEFLKLKKTFVEESPIQNQSKKVLVLGDDLSHYKGNMVATSLVNWHLDEKMFEEFDLYKNIISINGQLQNDKPEIIVDQYNNMKKIDNRVPNISSEYSLGTDGFYYLNPSK